MKTYGVAQQFQQTRHARRIYIGGLPPNYVSEDDLRDFLNVVISKGLGEDNDESYVLSIYINQKKCFAFVELKSIELTTACLELDGLIFKKIILKVLRANEYKPELIPPALLNKSIKLDLTSFPFGNPAASSYPGSASNDQPSPMDGANEMRLESLIQLSNLVVVERDSIAIVGFPYEDVNRVKTPQAHNPRGIGVNLAPKILRNSIRKYKFGAVQNPEFDIDISGVKFFDVGDVLNGKTLDESKANLSATVTEIVTRGAIPFIMGGSNDQSYHAIAGMLAIAAGPIGVIHISAQLDVRLLEDSRFLATRGNGAPTCDGRLVHFGIQVRCCCCFVFVTTTDTC